MIISLEVSYYPLTDEFDKAIENFIEKLEQSKLSVSMGKMSTVISGEYQTVMPILTTSMKDLMEEFPSVFTLKISNTCPV